MWTDGPVSSTARSNSRLIPRIGARVEIGALGNAGAVRIDAKPTPSWHWPLQSNHRRSCSHLAPPRS